MITKTNVKVVAILEMAEGNGEVGRMWKETKIFNIEDTLENVLKWATVTYNPYRKDLSISDFKGDLTLTIAQE